MTGQIKVGVIVGSLRRGSFSRQVAKALVARAPAGLRCEFIEIGQLPLYNEDLDDASPPGWVAYREALSGCQALLFVTPEYNRSVPGCLKNAIDIGSRPEGKNAFAGLPAAVVGVSPYAMGAFGANHALRQSFVFLDLAVMQQPEAYIGNVGKLLDEHGEVVSPETDKIFAKFMQAFERWATTVQHGDEDFDAFLARREAVSNDYIAGRAGPLIEIIADAEPATFFPPGGDQIVGVAAVRDANDKGAQAFEPGSTGRFEIMQSAASGGLAFWTGTQHATMRMKGKDEPVPMELRTTEVFRLEEGRWKLAHRHADMKPRGK
jgi:NAD(P)H-dependent FMN reductase/ketosteroid isomerase-like protein